MIPSDSAAIACLTRDADHDRLVRAQAWCRRSAAYVRTTVLDDPAGHGRPVGTRGELHMDASFTKGTRHNGVV